ncbi:beta strand repeat-containing protein [Maribacter sp. Asnod2-G09]|uniref:beta strand repeat-containing protein n=1 Tax=Maribacter sp. Asnod2-G09 TaxID=3160577 RepID=UPI003868820E
MTNELLKVELNIKSMKSQANKTLGNTIKFIMVLFTLLISGISMAQTTVTLEDQCNCEVLQGTDVSAPGVTTPAGADLGDLYVNTDTGTIYYWNGTTWELTSTDDNTTNASLTEDGVNLILTDSDLSTVSIRLADIADVVDTNTTNVTFTVNSVNGTLDIIDSEGAIVSVPLADIAALVNTDNQEGTEVFLTTPLDVDGDRINETTVEEAIADLAANNALDLDIDPTNELTTSGAGAPTAAPVNDNPGVTYLDTATNELYVYDGSNWTMVTDNQIAGEVEVTPAGNITANDVQSALEELDGIITSSELTTTVVEGTGIDVTPLETGNNTEYTITVDPTDIIGDGSIISTDIDVTGGANSTLNDVTLTIADDAITNVKMGDNAITTTEILDGTIVAADIANDAVNAATINADVAGTGLVQNATTGALEVDGTAADIANDAVNAATINADVAGTGLVQNATTGALEVDGTAITGDGDITSGDLTVGGDTNALLGDVTLEITAGAVGNTELAADAVTTDKIAAGAVETSDLANDAVALEKLANGTATGQVMQWDGTDWILIDLGSVTVTENDGIIGNEVVGSSNGTLTLSGAGSTGDPLRLAVSDDGITTNEIAPGAVETTDLSDDAVTLGKLAAGGNMGDLIQWNGTDWEYIAPSSLIPATTVSNTSTVNTLTTTVDGVTGTGVDIINSNSLTLNGSNELVSTVNGEASGIIDLSSYVNTDSQTISSVVLSPNETVRVDLVDGGNTTIDIRDADSDPNNEDQTVSAGTGISVNQVGDDFAVTNTAPDQTVAIADGGNGNVTVGGTYPNFTIDVPDATVDTDDQNLTSAVVTANESVEIQINDGTNTTIDIRDADSNASNELQTISRSGTNVILSNGGGTVSIADNDNNSNNEIQTITSTDGSVTVTPTGINYNLSVPTANGAETIVEAAPDTDISVTGSGTSADPYLIANTRPDIFYPPSIEVDVATTGTDRKIDLHAEYLSQYGTPSVVSTGAPAAIPTYANTELYYYVTYFDDSVFANVRVDALGEMTYDVIAAPTDYNTLINVVFVAK